MTFKSEIMLYSVCLLSSINAWEFIIPVAIIFKNYKNKLSCYLKLVLIKTNNCNNYIIFY